VRCLISAREHAEIKEKLNRAFSGARLQKLQDHWKNKEKLFNAAHRLERFCARAKLHPTKNYGTDNAKGKWYFLLKDILTRATDGSLDGAGQPVMTTDAIKAALTKALDFDKYGLERVSPLTRTFLSAQSTRALPMAFPLVSSDPCRKPKISLLVRFELHTTSMP
jgi:hypothetical protein